MPNISVTGLSDDLVRKLEDISDLPSLPEILLKVQEMCEREPVDIRALAALIETDAALTAKIVGTVSSLAYGLPNRLTRLEPCIVHLGIEAIRSIAVCAAISGLFHARAHPGRAAGELRRLWRHSLECALLARQLARTLAVANPDEVFLAGLVHDVGRHVLLMLFPVEYPLLLERGRANPEGVLAEEARLGGLHSAVGAWLIRRWKLPSAVVDAAGAHHEPTYRLLDAPPVTRIIHAADTLTNATPEAGHHPNERAGTLLGITPGAVGEAVLRAGRELAGAARGLGLDLTSSEPTPTETAERTGRLEREVRSVTQLLASLWSITRATDERGVTSTIFRALTSLFRLDQALYFTFDAARDTLVCHDSSRRHPPEVLDNYHMSREHSRCLVARACRDGAVLYHDGSGEAGAAKLDLEIRELLGGHPWGVYPLLAREVCVGALVVAAANGEIDTLKRRERPLLLLAAESAHALQADRRRECEQARIRAERIAAAQLTADRVAHEVRSPLAAIKNTVGALLQSPEAANGTRAALESITGEVDRVARLLGGLTRLGSSQPPVVTALDLVALVEGFLPVLSRLEASPRVAVVTRMDRGVPRVRGNADSLKQVLINLVRNSIEAMTEGGTVTIRVERDPAEGRGGCVLIVEDRGPGIPASLRGRLFEPFVTTKGEPHRGLGLAMVWTLARQMEADVRFEDVDGGGAGGARFLLTLKGGGGHG